MADAAPLHYPIVNLLCCPRLRIHEVRFSWINIMRSWITIGFRLMVGEGILRIIPFYGRNHLINIMGNSQILIRKLNSIFYFGYSIEKRIGSVLILFVLPKHISKSAKHCFPKSHWVFRFLCQFFI